MSTARDDILRLHRLTVADYHRMADAGILGPDDRVELIDGAIIDMTPIGTAHASRVAWLTERLNQMVGGRAIVWPQNPIVLDDFSEPQPDIVLLRPRGDFYGHRHPGPADVLLLIEVADTSLHHDRGTKIPVYARHGIPEVWLIDLQASTLQVFLEPTEHAYAREILPEDLSELAPSRLPDIQLDLSELFAGL